MIRPLPLPDAQDFVPFTYGDFVWEHMAQFVEFQGIHRAPRGVPSTENP